MKVLFSPRAILSNLLIFSLLSFTVYAKDISDSSLKRLQEKIDKADQIQSSSKQRREYKNIIRSAKSLLRRNKDADNRFFLIAKIFDCQKKQLTLKASDDIQEDLIETCKSLLQAPEEYASVRVEADALVTQIKMSQSDQTDNQKIMMLAEFADRYQNTTGEAKSLIAAADLAFNLGDKVLLKIFRDKLSSEFSHDPDTLVFLRERFAVRSGFSVQGTFKRADGKIISFPNGSAYIICFWSKDADLLDSKIEEIEKTRGADKDRIKVYSFNLDEFADGGARLLKKRNLNWIPMHLPGGTSNPMFESTGATNEFYTLVVNSFGISLGEISNTGHHHNAKSVAQKVSETLRDIELQPLLRYLFNGELLIQDPLVDFDPSQIPELKTYNKKNKTYTAKNLSTNEKSVPSKTLKEIQSLFVDYPERLTLTPIQALQNFEKIENLCDEALKNFPEDANLWIVHNRRIVSLLGQWRLKGDYQFFKRASGSAKQVLSSNCPTEAKLLAHFFIATDNFYHKKMDVEKVLNQFREANQTLSQTGRGQAASLILSILTHSELDYKKHRVGILDGLHSDPSSWPVSSFLLDKSSSDKLFSKTFKVHKVVGKKHELAPPNNTLETNLSTIDGKVIQIPNNKQDTAHALVFINRLQDRNVTSNTKKLLDHLKKKQEERPLEDLQVIPIFLDTDDKAVQAFLNANQYNFPAVCLKGKEKNVLSKQLGLYTVNDNPNITILNEYGEIQLSLSGLSKDTDHERTLHHRIDTVLVQHSTKLALQAFLEKDYSNFIHRLKTSYPLPHQRDIRYRHPWEKPNAHRRKLIWAYMETKQWDKALNLANVNIKAQDSLHNHPYYKGRKYCTICYQANYNMILRANLLKQLGRTKESEQILRDVDYPKCANGHKLSEVVNEVINFIPSRLKRNSRYKDTEYFLADYERMIRKVRQDRYKYKLENDHLIRSEIYKNMGKNKEAAADLTVAKTLSWPFETRKYDINHTLEASEFRREQAREDLRKKDYKKAIERVSYNIKIHEDEAVRCNSGCLACGDQIESYRLRAETLEMLGRKEEAEWNKKMGAALKCPTTKVDEYHKLYPYNRMYSAGKGKIRLLFIENHMLGKVHANPLFYADRMELARNLKIRSEAYKALGEKEKAEKDSIRAYALTYPTGIDDSVDLSKEEIKYVDIVPKITKK